MFKHQGPLITDQPSIKVDREFDNIGLYGLMFLIIKWWKIPNKNLDKVLLFLRNLISCLKKLWRAPTNIEFNNFCWNFAHVSYLPIFTKRCLRFVLFCLGLFYCQSKDLVSTNPQKPGLAITLDQNKVEKIVNTLL